MHFHVSFKNTISRIKIRKNSGYRIDEMRSAKRTYRASKYRTKNGESREKRGIGGQDW